MYKYNDAGQTKSLNGGYCGVRALAIAADISFDEAAKHLKEYANKGKAGSRTISRGIFKDDYDAALRALGFHWRPAPKFQGRKARCSDLSGTVIARQSRHYVAVIDGVANDIFDCSGKMVYGFWSK